MGGRNVLYGGPGADRLVDGTLTDTFFAGPGNDMLVLNDGGVDFAQMGDGDDTVRVFNDGEADTINGGGDEDKIVYVDGVHPLDTIQHFETQVGPVS